jgi:predicted ribosomally synthesized peptide with SipW-like signal peptide
MACVLCLGLIGGAFAYFSDTAASNANTFYAGDVDITLSGSLADGVTLDDMAPGDTVTGTLYVTNTGSLPIWFSGYLANDWAQSIGGFIDKFTVKVTTIPGDFYNFNPSQVIYNGPLTGLAGKENGLITANGVYTA